MNSGNEDCSVWKDSLQRVLGAPPKGLTDRSDGVVYRCHQMILSSGNIRKVRRAFEVVEVSEAENELALVTAGHKTL